MHTFEGETPPLGKHVHSAQVNHVKETKNINMKNKRVWYSTYYWLFKKPLWEEAHSGKKGVEGFSYPTIFSSILKYLLTQSPCLAQHINVSSQTKQHHLKLTALTIRVYLHQLGEKDAPCGGWR